jgi:indoleamine 2,3-dioxygenase
MQPLSQYHVSLVSGFLPEQDPPTCLPPFFAPWEHVAKHLSALLMAHKLRTALERLPILDIERLDDARHIHRAMLLLTVLGNAHVWAEVEPALRIPRGVAVPLWQVAERLGLPPIVAHAHMALHNWQRLDASEPIALDNLAALQLFLGGLDEQWFYMVTVAIEAQGGAAVEALVSAQSAAQANAGAIVVEKLSALEAVLARMSALLNRMVEQCDPYVFYRRIRPFVAGWPAPGVIYEGVSETPQQFIGGSAAQSPLIQAIDAGLGIRHEKPATQQFLTDMRHYMLPAHRRFIEALERGPSIRAFVRDRRHTYPAVVERYNACLKLLDTFRQKHIELSVRYILHQANDPEDVKGTGGTTFVPLLSEARKETKAGLL